MPTSAFAWSRSSGSSILTKNQVVDPISARKRRLAFWMAYLTGLSDVALSLQFQTFATMLTGNVMWLSRAVFERNVHNLLYYTSVIASYLTGISMVRGMRRCEARVLLRRVGVAVAALFGGADVLYHKCGFSRWLPVCMLAAAFGGINSMGTDFAGTLTFVVTGHLTRLSHFWTDLLVDARTNNNNNNNKLEESLTQADWISAKLSIAVTAGFFAGALTAFVLSSRNWLLRPGLFSTLGLGFGMALVSYDGPRIPRWWKRRRAPEMTLAPPTIQVVQATSDSEDEAVEAAVTEAVGEEKDVVVIVVSSSSSSSDPDSNVTTLPGVADNNNGVNTTLPPLATDEET